MWASWHISCHGFCWARKWKQRNRPWSWSQSQSNQKKQHQEASPLQTNTQEHFFQESVRRRTGVVKCGGMVRWTTLAGNPLQKRFSSFTPLWQLCSGECGLKLTFIPEASMEPVSLRCEPCFTGRSASVQLASVIEKINAPLTRFFKLVGLYWCITARIRIQRMLLSRGL